MVEPDNVANECVRAEDARWSASDARISTKESDTIRTRQDKNLKARNLPEHGRPEGARACQ